MLKLIHKVSGLLGSKARKQAYGVFALVLLMAIIEAAGVASIMPFVAVMSNPSSVETNPYLASLYGQLGFESTEGFMLFLGAATFLLLMSSILIRALTLWAQIRFTNQQIHLVGSQLVRHYLAQPYQWFLTRRTSDISVNVLSEVNNVIHGVVSQFMFLVTNVVLALLLFSLLVVVDPLLALLVTVVLGGAYGVIYLIIGRYLGRLGEQRLISNRKRFNLVQEAFGGIKDIKIGGLELIFLRRFQDPSSRFAEISTRGAVLKEVPSLAMQAVVFGGMLLVLLYLMWTHDSFQEALPYIALYALAAYRLMPALQGAYKNLSEVKYNVPALNSLTSDWPESGVEADLPSDPPLVEETREAPLRLETCLELKQVEFRYEGVNAPTIDNIDLRIDAHTTVAFVGSTGSGKTTLVDVILGLLKISRGELLVDGQMITEGSLRAWQRTVGYVPQNVFLADKTVTENIAFGVLEHQINRSAVERAARSANLHEFVTRELPHGYDTEIGERGVRLSGGQRQRIGIARALYHDPEFLVFDEATSALDNVTEHAVMDAVRQLGRRKTILLVAHRLSTVRDCDRIFLLECGKIIAAGTYQELLGTSERFREMATAGTG